MWALPPRMNQRRRTRLRYKKPDCRQRPIFHLRRAGSSDARFQTIAGNASITDLRALCRPSAFPFAIGKFWFDVTFKADGLSDRVWSLAATPLGCVERQPPVSNARQRPSRNPPISVAPLTAKLPRCLGVERTYSHEPNGGEGVRPSGFGN